MILILKPGLKKILMHYLYLIILTHFPIEIYPDDKLKHLAIMEGKHFTEETTIYGGRILFLYSSDPMVKTFRRGHPMEALNEVTPIRRDDIILSIIQMLFVMGHQLLVGRFIHGMNGWNILR